MTAPPDGLTHSERWEAALCAQIGSDLWFPEKSNHQYSHLAKEVCRTCPLLDQCAAYIADLEDAIGPQHGVWAGKSPLERMRQRRAAA